MKRGGRLSRHSGMAEFLRTGRVREDAASVWRRRRKVAAVLALALAILVPVLPAHAAADVGVIPNFPTVFDVGETQTATYSVLNISTGPEALGTMTVNDMRLVPSCSTFDPGCDAPGSIADPGTFDLSPTGTGELGTACSGRTFNITEINPATGEVRFTPADGLPVVLGPSSIANDLDVCRINFTVTAVRPPNHDTLPADAGASTNQLATVSATHLNGTTVTSTNEDTTTVVGAAGPATPTLTTTASPNVALGGQVTDTATLAGGNNPTGNITFTLYGPDNPTCTGEPAFTDTQPVAGNGSVTSAPFTPTDPGVYRWVAFYGGDANNNPVTSPCNAPNESVTVGPGPGPVTPSLATTASPNVALGGQVTDTATLAGGNNPTGTVTFNLYGPNDAGCTGAAVFTNTKPVAGNGTITSDPFTPTAPGVYRWVVSYSGDANNNPVTSPCNAPNESVTVGGSPGPVTPALSTQVTPAVATVGQPVTDTATLSGGNNPTGTITFNAYGPADANCTGAPVYSATVPVSGNGAYAATPAFTPTAPGTYRFVASYSGDAGNSPVAGVCNAPNESVTVTVAPSPSISVTKNAAPASLPAPGGTFTFTVVVANTGTVPVVITAMTDNVYGNLATLGGANSCDDLIGDTIGAGASSPACSFQGSFTGAAGDSQTDIVTVTAVDAAGNLAGGTDDATVSIGPAPPPEVPSISVEVTPSPSSIDEPGGPVTYRVVITNTSNPISLTITSLTDSVLGNIAALPEPNTCDSVIGMTLGPGESVTCEFTVQLTADADQDRSSIVTVTALASTGQSVSDSSPTVTVEVRDVVPRISVEKEASPESRPEPGGRFTFRVSITNEEEEPVVLTTLGDDMYGDLNGDGTCDTGATIAGGGTYSCEFSVQFTGEDGDRQTDTVIATVVDDEGNAVTETARATIRLTDPVAAAPATPTPTASPTPTTSPTPTASPTASPTPSPSASPTSSPTPSPSASPTAAPSPVPSPPAPGSISRTGIDSLGWFALSLALIAAGFLLRNAAPPGRRTLR